MTDVADRAVVLLSGGLDSATTLAMARAAGHDCHTLSVRYGQRHTAELSAAAVQARAFGAASHRTMSVDFGGIGGSALTDPSIAVPESPQEGIPVTYVPARNTVFLALALGLAEVIEAATVWIGVNAVDYSGYPDCRPEFIRAFQTVADLATRAAVEGRGVTIETPLIHLSKADIIMRGLGLGVDYSLTVSCYQADEEGRACGLCDACRLRSKGFDEAGVADPTRYRS
ncbi:MAG: 7-cyano-7-deazaguanine synthase QueC [Gammaproteobacteria bacterium]|jgi:7-cyano-7-deazaguanine synthase